MAHQDTIRMNSMRCVILSLLICFALGQDVDQGNYKSTKLVAGDWPFTQQDSDTGVEQRAILGSKSYWLLQVQGVISDSLKNQLNEYLSTKLTSLGQYFPDNTFLVQVSSDGSNIRRWLKKGPGVINVISFKSDFKIASKLKKLVNNETLGQNFTSIILHVQLLSGLDRKLTKSNTLVNSVISGLRNFLDTLTPAQNASVNVTRVSTTGFNVGVSDYSALQLVVIWLSNEVEVQWVERKPTNKPLNMYANRVVQADGTDLPLYDHGLHGDNIVIGVGDTGIDYDHCFFNDPTKAISNKVLDSTRRKIVYYSAAAGHALGDVKNGHGTHVAGTVGGICDPSINPAPTNISLFHGIATGAKLAAIQFGSRTDGTVFDTPDYLPDYFEEQRVDGTADLSSNSWGGDEWDFSSEAFYLDRYAHTHPDFIIIFAAGNQGDSRGWGSIISPSMAKNALTVGASDSIGVSILGAGEGVEPFEAGENEWRPAYFSSRGPTVDGRIKPDVLAPGRAVKSARSDGVLTSNQCKNADLLQDEGTSMATPVVAGLSAITIQYFTEGYYPSGSATAADSFVPPSSLLKAIMVTSGQSLAGSKELEATVLPTPDMIQGFGRVQLNTVLYFNTEPNFNQNLFVLPDKDTTPTISTGQRDIYCFKVSPVYETTSPGSKTHTFPLKATLVWTDFYGAMGSLVKAVNNLDLAVVQAGTGDMWLGNNLPNQQWDTLNNVEQVTLLNPNVTSGNGYFGVVVYGANVPEGPQAYSLVVTGTYEKQADATLCGTSTYVCPHNCGVGTGYGTCNKATGHCQCISSRTGAGCQSLVHPLTPVTASPLEYTIASQTLALHAFNYYTFTLSQATVNSLPTGLQIRVRTTQKWTVPVGLSIFFSMNAVPTDAVFTKAFYTHVEYNTTASAWNFNLPKALIKTGTTAGGALNFAIYNFCCGPLTFSVHFVQN